MPRTGWHDRVDARLDEVIVGLHLHRHGVQQAPEAHDGGDDGGANQARAETNLSVDEQIRAIDERIRLIKLQQKHLDESSPVKAQQVVSLLAPANSA